MLHEYIRTLTDEGNIVTDEGMNIKLLKMEICADEEILSDWAAEFRKNYCAADEIDILRDGYGYSREEYLEKVKFPDVAEKLGNATRSGDFAEILIADYIEYAMNYFVPRTRYDHKTNPNSSTQGSDLMGFKVGEKISSNDELIVFEIKCQASESKPKNRLQDAVDDSKKDVKRIAFSLNATFQRLIDKKKYDEAKMVQRFQNATDRPYKERYAAAAVHSKTSFSADLLKEVSTTMHTENDLLLLAVHRENLMEFIHNLYWRASKC
ncbi:MAG: Hachiman antiphage defense system protein HamA [Mobilitalea sp.]